MLDGVLFQMSLFLSMKAGGQWRDGRGNNHLDGAAPYYRAYETKDGKFVAVGALEQKFYEEFVDCLGLSISKLPERLDPANWEKLTNSFGTILKSKTQNDWMKCFDGRNACVTPVLDCLKCQITHIKARRSVVENHDLLQPVPDRVSAAVLSSALARKIKGRAQRIYSGKSVLNHNN